LKNDLERRYGLFTAICMVVGIVIGSGVFFKAQDILNYTNGNMLIGVIAWLIGGVIIITCSLAFSNLAGRYEKNNGVVDYAEATVGRGYGYFLAWFISVIYYPSLTSVLAFVSANYTLLLFNPDADTTGGLCMSLGAFYLCLAYAINQLTPKLAGKFQVSSTVIKLVPLVIMSVVGIIAGLTNGNLDVAFNVSHVTSNADFTSIFAAVAAAAFAYDGWVIATSINAEIKNSKRNLPLALMLGAFIIMSIYILYFVGLAGATNVDVLREKGATVAFTNLFGRVGGSLLNTFVVVSCLGTLNGLMLATTRSMYSMAVRDLGPAPKTLKSLDSETNMPANSGIVGLLLCGFWYLYFYAAQLGGVLGPFNFNSSELPIITIYALYIPIFIAFMIKEGKKNILKNVVLPAVAVISSAFMLFAAFYAHGIAPYLEAAKEGRFSFPVLYYLIVFAIIMAVGMIFYKRSKKKE